MRGRVFYLVLSRAELKEIDDFVMANPLTGRPEQKRRRKRAEAVWFSASQHLPVKTIAQILKVSERSIWRWFEAYQSSQGEGIERLKGKA